MSGVADRISIRVNLSSSSDGPVNHLVIYDWFTRMGTPPRGGNQVRVMVDGEEAWAQVYADLQRAERSVNIATWMLRPDTELVRPEAQATAPRDNRKPYRFGTIAEELAERGVQIRLLIWGITYTPIINRWLRKWYWQGPPQIDVLEQDHPMLIGSYHQKTITIDDRVGFCGGMNLKENDWDQPQHQLFEARRSPHRLSPKKRTAIVERKKKAPFLPRHDLMVRLEGPVVGDLAQNFQQRWNSSVRHRKASIVGRTLDGVRRLFGRKGYTRMSPPEDRPEPWGDRWVQIVRTMPGGENGILDAYRRAIANARKYVYIENQYFRSELIADSLRNAIRRNPSLRVAAVVWPINEGKQSWFNPMCYWTAHTQNVIREVRPNFRLTRLLSHQTNLKGSSQWAPIDVHAKVMIIDDCWITVGSANINDRGFRYEGEINVVTLDGRDARALRLRLMAEHLNIPPTQIEAKLGRVDDAFDLWDEHAAENRRRKNVDEAPLSKVHFFTQESVRFKPFGIGSGIF